MFVVGDSVSFISHDVLLSALGNEPYEDHSQLAACPVHPLCSPEVASTASLRHDDPTRVHPATLRYVRNDNVSLVTPAGATQFYGAWTHLVTNNTLLILNRGAHVVPDDSVVLQTRQLRAWLATHAAGAGVIRRATVRGHMEGTQLSPDANAALLPLAPNATREYPASSMFVREWHWDAFPRQNALVEAEINAATRRFEASDGAGGGFPGVVFLDVDASTGLRPDHHRDGIHYCIPGPLDHWLPLLQGVLGRANALASEPES